jgi:hypothetical protein
MLGYTQAHHFHSSVSSKRFIAEVISTHFFMENAPKGSLSLLLEEEDEVPLPSFSAKQKLG